MYDLCLTYLTTPTTHITLIVILINCTYIYCSSIINAKTSLFKFLQIWGRYVKVDKLFFFCSNYSTCNPKEAEYGAGKNSGGFYDKYMQLRRQKTLKTSERKNNMSVFIHKCLLAQNPHSWRSYFPFDVEVVKVSVFFCCCLKVGKGWCLVSNDRITATTV